MIPSVETSTSSRSGEGCGVSGRGWFLVPILLAALVLAGLAYAVLEGTGVLPGFTPSGPFPPFWWVFPLGFFAFWVFVWLVVRPWAWGGYWYRGGGWAHRAGAEEILRERFARGELSKDQLRRMIGDLEEVAPYRRP